jgi:uncharacterized protein YndB with AHSA1/START domain
MTETFTITRTLPATPEMVWDAWTKPEHFAVWFGTEAVEVPLDSVTLDVRVGGTLAATMNIPGGPIIHWAGEYTEVDPPRHLAFTLSDNPDQYAGVPIIATFIPVDGGTEVSLRQNRGDFSDEQVEATIAGYNSFFDSIERVLATLNP